LWQTMLSVLIAEDDQAMRHVLKKTLSQIPGVEVLGEAGDGITALEMTKKLRPRVVFIDIELPGKNGVDLAREICDINPRTILIFATAHDNHTHEAFEVYAFDYLVKPFKLDRIKKTIERIKQQDAKRTPVPIERFASPAAGKTSSAKLIVRQNDKMIFINTRDIIFITVEEKKSIIITKNDRFSITESLNSIEARLTGKTFFRSHRAFIINLNLIKEIYPRGRSGYEISFTGIGETALMVAKRARVLEKMLAMPGG